MLAVTVSHHADRQGPPACQSGVGDHVLEARDLPIPHTALFDYGWRQITDDTLAWLAHQGH
ncbi:hypothetical protein FRAHR75_830015 [Frankia sp. Hr75.2]|nr:hypothetical protein FRAHR75_830015 [Frankia sp. Hr75.2]SQD98340.1 hypothetical protein FMEAI12_4620017 [Parafrankia sp. Ea1.12]